MASERERLIAEGSTEGGRRGGASSAGASRYARMQSAPSRSSPPPPPLLFSSFLSFGQWGLEPTRIFEELPMAMIVRVSRPDAGDISPMLLSYVIEVQYKEFKWQLLKKAAQVLYLHFALKRRAFIEEIHEKQEQVKEWLHNIRIGDAANVMPEDDDDDDNAEDDSVSLHPDETAKTR